MIPDVARALRSRLVDVRALCGALGLQTAHGATELRAMVCCPWHQENTPSCSVRVAGDGTVSVRCHACGASGDALTLVAQVRGLDPRRDFRRVLEEASALVGSHVELSEVRPMPRQQEPESVGDETYHRVWTYVIDRCSPMQAAAPHVARYLRNRGVFDEAAAVGVRGLPSDARALIKGALGMFERRDLELAGVLRRGVECIDWRRYFLVIPWRDRWGRITFVQRRRLDHHNDGFPKYLSARGRSPRAPFGVELLAKTLEEHGPDVEVIFVEGAVDCLARRRIARDNGDSAAVLGVYSASSPAVGLPVEELRGRRVVLALDADEAGERGCRAMAQALAGVAGVFVREKPPEPAKDWAEALKRNLCEPA